MGKYSLSFDTAESAQDIRSLEDFLLCNRGSYNQAIYEQWLAETCIPSIERGDRRALVWKEAGKVVGDAIIVPEATDHAVLKNFRVAPQEWLQGRGMGDFLMRQAIKEAVDLSAETGHISRDANALTLRLDTTLGNPVQTFFERHGFIAVEYQELYEPGVTEVIMEKIVELV